jgi:hypothetical protein
MFPSILTNIVALIHARPQRPERRQFKRLYTTYKTPCLFETPDGTDRISAWIYDVSTQGIGILAQRAVPPGTTLRTLLVNAAHTCARPVEVEVVRCLRAAHGNFLLGGTFTQPLSHEELVPFIV